MRQILNTLYVMTPHSYLHLENDTIGSLLAHPDSFVAPALWK
jgi:hypothetical protein